MWEAFFEAWFQGPSLVKEAKLSNQDFDHGCPPPVYTQADCQIRRLRLQVFSSMQTELVSLY